MTAAGTLLGILVGLPVTLVLWGTSPLRGALGWEALRDVFYELGSERVLVGGLTIAAWAVWALFLRALVLELVDLRHVRSESLLAAGYGEPMAGGPLRTLARGLVAWLTMTVGSLGSLAGAVGAATAPPPTLATVLPASTVVPAEWSPLTATPAAAAGPEQGSSWAHTQRVKVTEPSDAWNLADRVLGDGRRWKELWVHNRDRLQPDGQRWTDPESTIRAGWELVVPSTTTHASASAPAPGEVIVEAPAAGEVIVEAGDNLWVLAERRLSEVWHRAPAPDEITPYWQQMIEANQERLAPPGDPDLIYPGQVFVTPAVPTDPAAVTVDETAEAAPGAPAPDSSPPATESNTDTPPPPIVDEAPPEAESELPATPEGEEPSTDGQAPATTGPPPAAVPEPAASEEAPPEPPATPEGEDAGDADGGERSDERHGEVSLPLAEVGIVGGASAALAVGITRAIRRRRRRRNHLAPTVAPAAGGGDEDLLRSFVLDADEATIDGLCRVLGDLAVRVAAAGQSCRPRVVQQGTDHLDVLLDRATLPPPEGWEAQAGGSIWSFAGRSSLPLGHPEGGPVMATPLLVTLGCPDEGGQLYLDLEAAGVVTLTGDLGVARDLAATLLVELAHSPFAANAQIVVVGNLGSDRIADLVGVTVVEDWASAVANFAAWVGQSRAALAENRWPNSFVARGHDADHDALTPLVVVAAEPPPAVDVVDAVQAGPTSAAVVIVGEPVPAATVIECRPDQLALPQFGLTCQPQVLEPDDVDGVAELLDVAEETSGGQLAFGFWRDLVSKVPDADGVVEGPYFDPPYEILVRLLGDVTVEGGGGALTGKQTALVAYIALHRAVSVDRVIDSIWAGVSSVSPRKRLANTVTKCRAVLGAQHLPAVRDNQYSVGPAVVTDVDLFERRVAAATQMPRARCAETLRDALDLVRGPVFDYPSTERDSYTWVAVENWVSVWELKITTVAQKVTELFLDLREPEAAAALAERTLRVVPTHPGLTEALMRAHDAHGDRLAARRVYHDHAEALEQLDLDTVAESTAALYEQLRSR